MSVCPSTIHKAPREATVPGTFNNPYSDTPPKRVTYCTICADAIQAVGMFTPDTKETK